MCEKLTCFPPPFFLGGDSAFVESLRVRIFDFWRTPPQKKKIMLIPEERESKKRRRKGRGLFSWSGNFFFISLNRSLPPCASTKNVISLSFASFLLGEYFFQINHHTTIETLELSIVHFYTSLFVCVLILFLKVPSPSPNNQTVCVGGDHCRRLVNMEKCLYPVSMVGWLLLSYPPPPQAHVV